MGTNGMSRIEREKRTVRKMIELYSCVPLVASEQSSSGRHHLHQDTMPDEYLHLADFACRRLDHCKYGENCLQGLPYPVLCSERARGHPQGDALGRAENDMVCPQRCHLTYTQ